MLSCKQLLSHQEFIMNAPIWNMEGNMESLRGNRQELPYRNEQGRKVSAILGAVSTLSAQCGKNDNPGHAARRLSTQSNLCSRLMTR